MTGHTPIRNLLSHPPLPSNPTLGLRWLRLRTGRACNRATFPRKFRMIPSLTFWPVRALFRSLRFSWHSPPARPTPRSTGPPRSWMLCSNNRTQRVTRSTHTRSRLCILPSHTALSPLHMLPILSRILPFSSRCLAIPSPVILSPVIPSPVIPTPVSLRSRINPPLFRRRQRATRLSRTRNQECPSVTILRLRTQRTRCRCNNRDMRR